MADSLKDLFKTDYVKDAADAVRRVNNAFIERNVSKGELVNPMTEKSAVEIVVGKKYLMVIHIPRNTEQSKIKAIQDSTPLYDSYFKSRGIDMTLMVTDEPIQVYELEGACQTPKS